MFCITPTHTDTDPFKTTRGLGLDVSVLDSKLMVLKGVAAWLALGIIYFSQLVAFTCSVDLVDLFSSFTVLSLCSPWFYYFAFPSCFGTYLTATLVCFFSSSCLSGCSTGSIRMDCSPLVTFDVLHYVCFFKHTINSTDNSTG